MGHDFISSLGIADRIQTEWSSLRTHSSGPECLEHPLSSLLLASSPGRILPQTLLLLSFLPSDSEVLTSNYHFPSVNAEYSA